MRIPFFSAKVRVTSPYADIYSRAVGAGIDISIIFILFSSLFFYSVELIGAQYCYEVPTITTFTELMQMAIEKNFAGICLLDKTIQVGIIGVLLVSTQIVWGTTPGKWLVGIKVVRAETLEPIPAWRYVLRFFAYIPAILPCMIGIFWISFNRKRRGWHDYIAGTVVIHTRGYEWYKKQAKALWKKYVKKSGTVE
jgi:hypothetical protein